MPKHPSVGKAIQQALKECGNSGRSGHKYAVTASDTVFRCRKKLSEYYSNIFYRMVSVNVQVALHFKIDTKATVYTEGIEHMIKKAYSTASRKRALRLAYRKRHFYLRFLSISFHFRLSHNVKPHL
jgi:hypothetical protein